MGLGDKNNQEVNLNDESNFEIIEEVNTKIEKFKDTSQEKSNITIEKNINPHEEDDEFEFVEEENENFSEKQISKHNQIDDNKSEILIGLEKKSTNNQEIDQERYLEGKHEEKIFIDKNFEKNNQTENIEKIDKKKESIEKNNQEEDNSVDNQEENEPKINPEDIQLGNEVKINPEEKNGAENKEGNELKIDLEENNGFDNHEGNQLNIDEEENKGMDNHEDYQVKKNLEQIKVFDNQEGNLVKIDLEENKELDNQKGNEMKINQEVNKELDNQELNELKIDQEEKIRLDNQEGNDEKINQEENNQLDNQERDDEKFNQEENNQLDNQKREDEKIHQEENNQLKNQERDDKIIHQEENNQLDNQEANQENKEKLNQFLIKENSDTEENEKKLNQAENDEKFNIIENEQIIDKIENEHNAYEEEINKNENPEDIIKKIQDYSFSSSEDESELKNNKKNFKEDSEKNENQLKNEEKQKIFQEKISLDHADNHPGKNENCDLDELEFEECEENTPEDNQQIKQSTEEIKEEDDIFDFVEEDQNTNENIIIKKSLEPSIIDKENGKEKYEMNKNDVDDDEFDFIEESGSNTNQTDKVYKKKENTLTNNNEIEKTQNIQAGFRNKDQIFNLINIYISKYISTNNQLLFFNQAKLKEIHESTNAAKEITNLKEEKINSKNDEENFEEDEFTEVENEPSPQIENFDNNLKEEVGRIYKLMNFNFEINEEKYKDNDLTKQSIGFENLKKAEISEQISIQKTIDNIKYIKSEPEMNLRGYSLEELQKISRSYNSKLNIKQTLFNHSLMEYSNESIQRLYFKFSDLREVNYINLQNQIKNYNCSNNPNELINKNIANSNLPINFQKNNVIYSGSILDKGVELEMDPNNINKPDSDLKKRLDINLTQKESFEFIDASSDKKTDVSSNIKSGNDTINIFSNDINEKEKSIFKTNNLVLLNEKSCDLLNKNKEGKKTELKQNGSHGENQENPNFIVKVESEGIDPKGNKINMQANQRKEIDSDSFDEIKEDSDEDNTKEKPKFVMNELMSSLVMSSNTSYQYSTYNSNINQEKAEKNQELEGNIEENREKDLQKSNAAREDDMIEMLKSMGLGKKVNNEGEKISELEKDNKRLNEIINKLPNLNYLTSKYVEIPDSIFNI